MQAIVYRNYGPPHVLRLEEIQKPAPRENEVLIRIHAASVNPYDWHFMRGAPWVFRFFIGLGRPRFPGLGADLAGVVESVGRAVTGFKPGDPVFGMGRGSFADYACAPASQLARKPESMTFEHAASIPIAGLTAQQALRDKAHVQPGARVLINGAAGGVGTFAVQMAKGMGAEVTGVCSARNVDLVRSLGADHVIDYNREDFTRSSRRYDAILECVGNQPFSICRHALAQNGIFVGIGAGGPNRSSFSLIGGMARNKVVSWFTSQKNAGFVAKANPADLEAIAALITAGKLKPVIDRQFKLAEVPDAMRYVETGHARGKVLIGVLSS